MKPITGKEIIALKNIILKYFNKSDWIELGYLVDANEIVERHQRLLRSLDFGDDDYEGNILEVLKDIINEKPDNYEEIKEFINSKTEVPSDAKVVSTFSKTDIKETIVFSPDPEIFKIPAEEQNNKLVSVMMPFNVSMDGTIKSIRKTCEALGVECKRADDMWNNNTFIQDIFDLIFISQVVIADFTGKNPNVFYEVGIAHALGKTVIPITQSIDDVPADLRHHRVLKYLPNGEGFQVLQEELTKRLKVLFPDIIPSIF